MKFHRLISCLAFCLVLTPVPISHAKLLQTQDWEEWNAASRPLFPDESWKQYATPEEAGWSSEKLASAKLALDLAGSEAVIVIYNGAVLTQWGQVQRPLRIHSIWKSFLSALYGIAVASGDIDIAETIGSIGIDDDTGLTATEKSAKVSDLLKSRSGIYLPAAYETPSSRINRPERGSHKPGTYWYYNNWDFNALATIYNKKTSGDVAEDFGSYIAAPLQMQDFDLEHTNYHVEANYSRHPAYIFRMSARDLARFGLLFLNEGRWKDKQIIPTDWVRESTQAYSKFSDSGYGYMWWTTTGQLGDLGTYAAAGFGGHFVFIVPGAKLVLTHHIDAYHRNTVNWAAIENILKLILKARIGPPKEIPKLVDMPASLVDDVIESSPQRIVLKQLQHVQKLYEKAEVHCASHGKKSAIGQIDRFNNIYEFLCY